MQVPVPRAEVVRLLRSIRSNHFQASDYAIWGSEDTSSKNYTIQFQGSSGRGARLAKKALDFNRSPDGQWTEHFVTSSLGDQ
eukprot:2906787-Karenia_brevis.AAC.1